MKTTIFYFTGTGNSLKVARDLAKEIRDTELVYIPRIINTDINLDCDKIGIVFPVYMWGLPLIVSDFIKKIKTDKYVFAVATCGGMASGALLHAKKQLQEQGVILSAGFVVNMPGNYTPLYGAPSKEKQDKLFIAASDKIKKIAEIIKNNEKSAIESGVFLSRWIFSGLIHSMGSSRIMESDKSFWVNDKCNSCGTCAEVCPVKNITILSGKPLWQHHCQQCMACLQWCPTEAIQYGKNTQGRKRYRHPEVKINDLIY